MLAGLLQGAGGLGLFLLGMVVMTEGLRALPGDSLRRVLARFTKSPLSGAVTGAATTAIVQSSSATTIAAVGFAGAGLLTFPQALGILFGANIGTTVTGWLVALLGFKLKIGTAMLPLVLVGALLRLFGSGRTAAAGYALAGFGLIFVGIGGLQAGMAGLEGVVTPASFPGDTLGGRLLLVGIGVGITLVTQSSSAGVATALAAVHAGAISYPQAAAMVIGMDMGTTVKAALATVGGSVQARRTGWAHVIYNVFTGAMAFVLLTPWMWLLGALGDGALLREPEIALVAFHTFFNTLGVILVLPFADRFAKLVIRLVPERVSPFARRLDASLLAEPPVAVEALDATLTDLAQKVFSELLALLRYAGSEEQTRDRLALVELALAETRRYAERVTTSADLGDVYRRHVSAMHVIDHLGRLVDRCGEAPPWRVAGDPELARAAEPFEESLALAKAALSIRGEKPPESDAHAAWESLHGFREAYRKRVMERAAAGDFGTEGALDRLDAFRWLRRIAYHAWRVLHHLRRVHFESALEDGERPPHEELEVPD